MNNTGIDSLILIRAAGLPAHWLEDLEADCFAQLAEAEAQTTAAAKLLQAAFDQVLAVLPASAWRTSVYNARRVFFQKQKLPAQSFYTALTAQKDIPELVQLLENLTIYSEKQGAQNAALQQIQRTLEANYTTLQACARDETLQRALLFASHDLLDRLPDFCAKPVEQFTKKDRQTAHSVLQYVTRAVAKTSPLSRFTTVHFWNWEQAAAPDFFDAPKVAVVPNVGLLPVIYAVLLREPAFYTALKVGLNPCITADSAQTGQALEFLYFDGTEEAFQSLDANPAVDLVVKTLLEKGRSMQFPALIIALQDAIDATDPALQSLVFELIDLGLLYWELPEKGLTPSWCSGLYNYLGFLPASPVHTDTAYLLQWLRTAARTLAFQSLDAAQATQREAVQEVRNYLERYGSRMPAISPEQVFFEDVAQAVAPQLPPEAIRALTDQLADCWMAQPQHGLPPFRSQLLAFAHARMAERATLGFLEFCRDFLLVKDTFENAATVRSRASSEKIGALLQFFQDETGNWRAVVNALFPGGGKMMARWRHLTTIAAPPTQGIGFPWQGFSNANFQPIAFPDSLAVPDGRVGHLPNGRTILLGDLLVVRTQDVLHLRDRISGQTVVFNDLGLEAPETRPPAMQVLWQLGVPYVALAALLPEETAWEAIAPHVFQRKRIEYQSLILSRTIWHVAPDAWKTWLPATADHRMTIHSLRSRLVGLGIPSRFFAYFPGRQERPQYFSLNSPVSLVLLEKTLRTGRGNFIITEMLPVPEQSIVAQNGLRATEFVVEITVKNTFSP